MSILIKGIDMPKECSECRFYVDKWCYALEPESDEEKRWLKGLMTCPLVEIPTPHGRPIDTDIAYNNGVLEIAVPSEDFDELIGIVIRDKSRAEFRPILKNRPTILKAE